ncbi:MAG TPA: hypothetical protein DCM05_02170 [Elusimicrobia bacterium]|nr:hypothetical protein [Elusimicrobiota bacterium]
MKCVDSLRARAGLTDPQAALLDDIETGRLFSLHREIKALFYLGATFIVFGVGATLKDRLMELGPLTILSVLALAVAACYGYCFKKAGPYSEGKTGSPTAGFDYVLYLGCAFLGLAFGYAEAKFQLLDRYWDFYLLGSGCLFFALAYRFDNRFVLSMAILNLAGWLGVRLKHFEMLDVRTQAMLFAAALIALGKFLEDRKVKAHFTDTYLLFGLHLLFWSLLADVFPKGFACWQFPVLAALTVFALNYSFKRRRFDYFLYSTVYGYLGFSSGVVHHISDSSAVSLYVLVSSVAVIVTVFRMRRSLEQDPC